MQEASITLMSLGNEPSLNLFVKITPASTGAVGSKSEVEFTSELFAD